MIIQHYNGWTWDSYDFHLEPNDNEFMSVRFDTLTGKFHSVHLYHWKSLESVDEIDMLIAALQLAKQYATKELPSVTEVDLPEALQAS